MASAEEFAEIQYEQDHVDDTHVPQLAAVFTAALVIAHLAVVLRLISRRLSHTQLKWDDLVICLSLVSPSLVLLSTHSLSGPYDREIDL